MALTFRPHEVLHGLQQQMFTFLTLISNTLNMMAVGKGGGVVLHLARFGGEYVQPENVSKEDYEEWRLLGCYAVWLL
jgi:hypothetical protein